MVEGYPEEVVAPFLRARDAFNDLLGIEWELLSPDEVVGGLDVRPDLLQPYGIVQGGVYCSLVEAVGSLAGAARVMAEGRGAVGVANATSFVRPTRSGRLTATATPIHVGRSSHLWRVDITRDDGQLAAHGELRMQVVDHFEHPGA